MFSVHTLAASPYGVLLASSTASAGVRNVIETSTGPKISTWAIVAAGDTFVESVGGEKEPSVGQGPDRCHLGAPPSTPPFTSWRVRSSCTRATLAPPSSALSR